MTSHVQSQTAAGSDGRQQVTEPAHYGAINAAYLVLLGGLIAAWTRRGQEAAIPRSELPTLAIATFALAKVVAHEKIGTWVREPFVDESPERQPKGPRGQGMRRAIGELLTCTRCVGAWAALAVVGLRVAAPEEGRLAATVLATSGINDFLQAGFRLTTEGVNRIDE